MAYARPESWCSGLTTNIGPPLVASRDRRSFRKAFDRVLRRGQFVLSEETRLFEEEYADYIGAGEAIGVANGTDAIEIALRSLNLDAGDQVITASHTAVATVAAVESAGLNPVLVDIERDYFTIDPERVEQAVTSRTRVVLAVHLYGQPANMAQLRSMCDRLDLHLIEDVSQAHGSIHGDSRVGSIGVIGCFSLYPTKNLGALGDAGIIVTSNQELASRMRALRQYGWDLKRQSLLPGRNSRLDELQSAFLRQRLRHLDSDNTKRRELASYYSLKLKHLPLDLPKIRENSEHVFHQFVIRLAERDKLRSYLATKGIVTGIHYPTPVHLQPAYAGRLATSTSMAETESACQEILSLPIGPEMRPRNAKQVVREIEAFFS